MELRAAQQNRKTDWKYEQKEKRAQSTKRLMKQIEFIILQSIHTHIARCEECYSESIDQHHSKNIYTEILRKNVFVRRKEPSSQAFNSEQLSWLRC